MAIHILKKQEKLSNLFSVCCVQTVYKVVCYKINELGSITLFIG